MQQGAGFRIAGSVVRKFVNQAFTFAALTISVDVDGRTKKIDVRAFGKSAPEAVEEIAALHDGAMVEVTGSVEMEKLTDKQQNAIQKDGRDAWVPALTVKVIKVEASSRAPKPAESASAKRNNNDVDW